MLSVMTEFRYHGVVADKIRFGHFVEQLTGGVKKPGVARIRREQGVEGLVVLEGKVVEGADGARQRAALGVHVDEAV